MSKVLVVGGAGYIGGAITDLLNEENIEYTVYDNLLYEDIYMKPVDLIVGDIRDTDKLGKIINDYDVVVWLAAIVGDGACAVDPDETVAVNEKSVEWLRDNYNGKIIFMSTCSVYGANNDLGLTEESPVNPLSLYAGTKVQCEKILEDRPNTVIFRLGTVHGIGDYFSRIRTDLVVNVLTMRASLGLPLTVFGGEQWRPVIHVFDIAEAVINCITGRYNFNSLNGVYNLVGNNITIRDIAEVIKTEFAEVGLYPEVKFVDQKFEDLRNYNVSKFKLKDATGWIPRITLEETIAELRTLFTSGRVKTPHKKVFNNQLYLESKKNG